MAEAKVEATLPRLFWTFFKIGGFTFGGGQAMISIIENELVHKKGWVDEDRFYKYLTLAQMAPGILAVNISILMGKQLFGRRGAVLFVVATCLPPFLIILLVAIFYEHIKDSTVFNSIFRGIRPIVLVLILMPVISMAKKAKLNLLTALIPIAIVVLIAFLKVSPVYVILGSVALAFVLAWFKSRQK